MKTNYFIYALVALSIYSCKDKDKTVQPQGDTPKGAIQSFHTRNAAASQTFTVDVSNSSAMITAAEGTTVMIPEDAFVNASGQAVSGSVTIEVKEIYDQAGMVLSGITSVSNGEILESAGEIYINATSGGQQLFLADAAEIVLGTPKDTTWNDMQLFEGKGTGDNFNWDPIQQDTTMEAVNDSIGGGQGGNIGGNWNNWFMYDDFFCTCYNATRYFTSISNLGWCNIDRFYWQSGALDITINSPGFTDANSSVFVVLKNDNVAINVYADIIAHSGSYGLSLPANTEVTVIAIGNKDGKFYMDIKDYTVTNGISFDLDLQETTEANLINEINTRFDN